MSQFNGDKARFNRERKQNIQRRKRNRALFQAAGSLTPIALTQARSLAAFPRLARIGREQSSWVSYPQFRQS